MADQQIDGSGYRARLRQRLLEGGPDALLDHELVEYLLALAIPRRDTKLLAKKLIREFGSFGALLSADGPTISKVGEVSEGAAAALKIAQAAALRLPEKGRTGSRSSAAGRRSPTISTPTWRNFPSSRCGCSTSTPGTC